MAIIVYNRNKEDHTSSENNYPIYRGGSVLGNPFTEKKLNKTLAIYQAKDRADALKKYSTYFDTMYGKNPTFTYIIDEMYEKYKRGETIYLECYCAPLPCHGDIIAQKLQKRLLKEKINECKQKKYAK